MDKAVFSQWLNEKLISKSLTQAQLAKRSGLSRQAISNFVNQVSLPSTESCMALARGLGLPSDQVLEAAGHRVSAPGSNPTLEEANFKLAQLPAWQQRLVISFIDTLSQQGANENPASPLVSPDSN